MKPEILFLAHRIPYPPDKGDKIRSWRLLKHLTKRFRVHLACFVDDPRDLAHREFLESHCESLTLVSLHPGRSRLKSLRGLITGNPLSFEYFQSREMRAAVRDLRKKPLAAEIVFSSSMAPYVESGLPYRLRIVDFCDADSEKWRQYAHDTSGPMAFVYKREAKTLAREENRIANWADAAFAVTAEEADLFNRRSAIEPKVGWFPNGVDTAYFDPEKGRTNEAPVSECVFVGAMDYRANIDGVRHFLTDVWPLVRKEKPEALFTIVGANPPGSITAHHGSEGVTVTGRVADVRPWLSNAKIVVAPLRVARGVQNKVLEAMAMAKPVVASKEAMTGVAAPENAAVTANGPSEMAQMILKLCSDEKKRRAMGEAARSFVLQHHQWDQALARFDEKLAALGL